MSRKKIRSALRRAAEFALRSLRFSLANTFGSPFRRLLAAHGFNVEPLETRQLLSVSLVKDINTLNAGSSPHGFTTLGTYTYFAATDSTHGTELWRSDGSSGGTMLVADISPGSGSGDPQNLYAFGGKLFFSAQRATEGRELWSFDPATSQASLIKDISAASNNSSTPTSFVGIGANLYFVADSFPVTGLEVYKTDGTAAGTSVVKDIVPGWLGSSPTNLMDVNGVLHFTATSGTGGAELWRSDGTATGTVQIADINAGSASSSPSNFAVLSGQLYFSATNGNNGVELWRTTTSGVEQVADINTGSGNSDPSLLQVFNGKLLFKAATSANGMELWSYDPANGVTALLKDVWSGSSSGLAGTAARFVAAGGSLYFFARDAANGFELWKTDGTTAGTALVKNLNSGNLDGILDSLQYMTAVNNTLYFTARSSNWNFELWKTDGTANGTVLVTDVRSGIVGSNPSLLTTSNGSVFFAADNGTTGTELYVVAGAGQTAQEVININTGTSTSEPHAIVRMDDNLFLWAADNNGWSVPFISDGTAGGTKLITSTVIETYSPSWVKLANGVYVFTARASGTVDYELWRTDGTAANTVKIADIYSGATGSDPQQLIKFGSYVYFSAHTTAGGRELWRTDGTTAGTTQAFDANSGSGNGDPQSVQLFDNKLFFAATDSTGSRKVYYTDGSATSAISAPGGTTGGYSPDFLTVSGGKLYFAATTAAAGRELWYVTAATASPTLIDYNAGSASTYPDRLLDANGTLYFRSNPNNDWDGKLAKTTGTVASTLLLIGTDPNQTIGAPSSMTLVGTKVFFSALTNATHYELFATDGTNAGTVLVKDIAPGQLGSWPSTFLNVDGILYFVAGTVDEGNELWKSDGTAQGTVMVADIWSGSAGSAPRDLVRYGDQIVFSADTGGTGRELWSLQLPADSVRNALDSITATALSSSTIRLNFSNNSLTYRVFKSMNGTTWTPVTTITPGSGTYDVTGLTSSQKHWLKVTVDSLYGPYKPTVLQQATLAANGALAITGTSGNDVIALNADPSMITVTLNGVVQRFAASAVTSINVMGAAGNDLISLIRDGSGAWSGGPVTLNGEDGNDTIYGSALAETLQGGADDDSILAGDGNDQLEGNNGNDTLVAGGGDDTLFGNSGNDVIFAGGAGETNSLDGGSGVDFAQAGTGDILTGSGADFRLNLTAPATIAEGTPLQALLSIVMTPGAAVPEIQDWTIDWGDGNTSTLSPETLTASHTYMGGTYSASLDARVNFGTWSFSAPSLFLDTDFADGGTRIYSTSEIPTDVRMIVPTATGRSFIITYSGRVYRTLINGDVDPTFGNGGYLQLSTPAGATSLNAHTFLPQSDGGLLVISSAYRSSDYAGQLIVSRYTAVGALDTSFGTNGHVLNVGGQWSSSMDAVQAADGAMYVLAYDNGERVKRLQPNGIVDTSFAGTIPSSYGSELADIQLSSDGDVLVLYRDYEFYDNWTVAKFNHATGALISSFGDSGVAVTPAFYSESARLESMPDGRLMITPGNNAEVVAVRMHGDGSMDPTFSTDGMIELPSSDLLNWGYSSLSLVDRQGRLYLVFNSNGESAIYRYRPNGLLDLTWGDNGRRTADATDVLSIDLLSDGRVQMFALVDGKVTQFRLGAIAVRDVAPVTTFAGEHYVSIDGNAEITIDVSDVGGVDVTHWIIDWGDGATSIIDLSESQTASHAYAALGSYSITGVLKSYLTTYSTQSFSVEVVPATSRDLLRHIGPIKWNYEGTRQQIDFTFDTDMRGVITESDFRLQNVLTGGLIDHNYFHLDFANGGENVSLSWETLPVIDRNPIGVLPDGNHSISVVGIPVEGQGGADPSLRFRWLNGDFNGDHVVGFDDLLRLAQNYNQTSAMRFDQGNADYNNGQVDNNGNPVDIVNFDDLLILAQRYGSTMEWPPTLPGDLKAVFVTKDTVTLSWRPPAATGYTGFKVMRRKEGDASAELAGFVTAPATVDDDLYVFNDTDRFNGTRYFYTVVPFDGTGDWQSLETVSAVTVLPMPLWLSASAIGMTSAVLSWDDDSDGETGFELQRSDDALNWVGATTFTNPAHTGEGRVVHEFNNLQANRKYYFRVRAKSAAAVSAWSASMEMRTLAPSHPPLNLIAPLSVDFGNSVTLRAEGGAGSPTDTLSYAWRVTTGGRDVALDSPVGNETVFTPKVPGAHLIEVMVMGSSAGIAWKYESVQVVASPTVVASLKGPALVETGRRTLFRLPVNLYRIPSVMEREFDEWNEETSGPEWVYTWESKHESDPWTTSDFSSQGSSPFFRPPDDGAYQIKHTVTYKGQLVVTATANTTAVAPAQDDFKKHVLESFGLSTYQWVYDRFSGEYDERGMLAKQVVELVDGKILTLSNEYGYDNTNFGITNAVNGVSYPNLRTGMVGVVQRLNADLTVDTTFGDGVTESHALRLDASGEYLWDETDGSGLLTKHAGTIAYFAPPVLTYDPSNPWSSPAYNSYQPNQPVIFGAGGSFLAVQPDGKFIIASNVEFAGFHLLYSPGNGDAQTLNGVVVLRYNSDGSADTSFGTDGMLFVNGELRPGDATSPQIKKIMGVQVSPFEDKAIWITGIATEPGTSTSGALIKISEDGELDTTFDSDGIFVLNKPNVEPVNLQWGDSYANTSFFRDIDFFSTPSGYDVVASGGQHSWSSFYTPTFTNWPVTQPIVVRVNAGSGATYPFFGDDGIQRIETPEITGYIPYDPQNPNGGNGPTVGTKGAAVVTDVDVINDQILVTARVNAWRSISFPSLINEDSVFDPGASLGSQGYTYSSPYAGGLIAALDVSNGDFVHSFGEDHDSDDVQDGYTYIDAPSGYGYIDQTVTTGISDGNYYYFAGTSSDGGVVGRLLPNGKLDTGFGTGGLGMVLIGTDDPYGTSGPYSLGAGRTARWNQAIWSTKNPDQPHDLILGGRLRETTDPGGVHPNNVTTTRDAIAVARYVPPTNPEASDLSASLQADGSVRLDWVNGSRRAEAVEIQRKSTASSWETPGVSIDTFHAVGDEEYYIDWETEPNTTYYYRIAPVWESMPSARVWSNTASATTWPADDGAVLQEVVYVPVNGDDVWTKTPLIPGQRYRLSASGLFELSWNNPANPATMQTADAEYGFLPRAWVFKGGPEDRVPTGVNGGAGIDYGISVRAVRLGEPSPFSSPTPPGFLPGEAIPTSSSQLIDGNKGTRWGSSAATGEHRYTAPPFTLKPRDGDPEIISPTPIVFRYHDSYYADNSNIGDAEAALRVEVYRSKPSSPGKLVAAADRPLKSVKLNWTNQARDGSVISIERATLSASGVFTAFELIASVGGQVESYEDTSIAFDTLYAYRVRVTNDFASSNYSNESIAIVINEKPEIEAIPGLVAQIDLPEGEERDFRYQVVALDAEHEATGLIYSLEGAPAGMTIVEDDSDPVRLAGLISWHPMSSNFAAGQSFSVAVRVTDPDGGFRTLPFSISLVPNSTQLPQVTASGITIGAKDNAKGEVGLSVNSDLAIDDFHYTYTWSVTGKPVGAPTPTFAGNGTHDAKSMTAKVRMAGDYTFAVRIRDGTPWYTDVVALAAVSFTSVFSSFRITPPTSEINASESITFKAQPLDQFGRNVPPVPLEWSREDIDGHAEGSIVAPTNQSTVVYTSKPYADLQSNTAQDRVRVTSGATSAYVDVIVRKRSVANEAPKIDPNNVDVEAFADPADNKVKLRLTAKDAFDPDGNVADLKYHWTVAWGAGSSGTLPSITPNNSHEAMTAVAEIDYPGKEINYVFTLTVTDGDGDPSGTVTIAVTEVEQGGLPNLPTGLKVHATSIDGNLTSTLHFGTNSASNVVFVNANDVGSSSNKIRLSADLYASNNLILDPEAATVWNWSLVNAGGSLTSLSSAQAFEYIVPDAHGERVIRASGTLNGTTKTLDFVIRVIGDEAPILQIGNPVGDAYAPTVITEGTPIKIIADDPNPGDTVAWKLKLVGPNGNTVTLSDGTNEVGIAPGQSEEVVVLQPTLYANGVYRIELYQDGVTDPRDTKYVRIDTKFKLGNFNLPITDLSHTLPNGDTIELTRVYDSAQASVVGEFGFGWRQELKKSGITSSSLRKSGFSGAGSLTALAFGDLVYVTVPNVGQLAYAFMPKPTGPYPKDGGQGIGLVTDPLHWVYSDRGEYYPQFVSIDGSGTTLGFDNSTSTAFRLHYDSTRQEFYRLVGGIPEPIDPTLQNFGGKLQVGLADGTNFQVKGTDGSLEKKIDSNGNETVYAASNQSYSIKIETQAGFEAGTTRIWKAGLTLNGADYADGKYIEYQYDASTGDLIKVTDRNGQATSYHYNAQHYLDSIRDTRGASILNAKYAPNGELIELKDIQGNPVRVSNGSLNQNQLRSASTDPLNNSVERIYNAYGDVVREIQGIRDESTGTVTRYLVSVSEYTYQGPAAGDLEYQVINGSTRLNRLAISTQYAPIEASASERYTIKGTKASESVYYNADNEDVIYATPTVQTVWDSNGPQTTKSSDFERERPRVVEDANERYTLFNYDAAGNLVWSLDQDGNGAYTVYSDGNTNSDVYSRYDIATYNLGNLPKGLTLASYRIKLPALVVPAGWADNAPGRTLQSFAEANTTDRPSGQDPFVALQNKFQMRLQSMSFYNNTDNSVLIGERGKIKKTVSFSGSIVSGAPENRTETYYTYTPRGEVDQVSHRVNAGPIVFDSSTDYSLTGQVLKSWSGNRVSGVAFTENWYDTNGRVLYTVNQFGQKSFNIYDIRGNAISSLSSDGTETRSYYDELGRAEWTSERFASTTQATIAAIPIDLAEHITSVVFSNLDTSTYKLTRAIYDSAGRSSGSEVYRDGQIVLEPDVTSVTRPDGSTGSIAGLLKAREPSLVALTDASKRLSRSQTFYNKAGRVGITISSTGLMSGTAYYPNGQIRYSGIVKPGQESTLLDGTAVVAAATFEEGYTEYESYGVEVGGFLVDTVKLPGGITSNTKRSLDGRVAISSRAGADVSTILTGSISGSPGQAIALSTTMFGLTLADTAIPTGISALLGNFGIHTVSIDEMGRVTHRVTNADGQLTDVWLPKIQDALNGDVPEWSHWHYTYDANGNEKTHTDPIGTKTSGTTALDHDRETVFDYDERNRRTKRTLPADDNPTGNDFEKWTYHSYDRVKTHVDFNGQTTAYLYEDELPIGDARRNARNVGQLVAEYRYAAGVTVTVNLEGAFNFSDAAERTEYEVDALGRTSVVKEFNSGTGTTIIRQEITSFDPISGQVASRTTEEGTINYSYYPKTGRLLRTWTANTDTVYTYDSRGRLVDTISLKLKGVSTGTFGGLDANGKPVITGSPIILKNGYGPAGQLEWTLNDMGTPGADALADDDIFTDYRYDGLGRLEKEFVTRGGNVDQTSGSVTGGASVFSQVFELRDDGQRESVSETRSNGHTSTTTWTYDAQNHLKKEDFNASWDDALNPLDYTTEFFFDLAGNRITKTTDNGRNGIDLREAYAYNDRNQLRYEGVGGNNDRVPDPATDIVYQYDANGAQTLKDTNTTDTTYFWDKRGRLESMTETSPGSPTVNSTFGYDSSGQRVSQKKGSEPQRTFLQDKNNLTGYPQTLEEWVGGTIDRAYFVSMRVEGQLAGAGLQMFVRDAHGSNRALLDDEGYVAERYDYQAFGEKISFVRMDHAGIIETLNSEGDAATTHLHAGDGEYDILTSWYYNDARYRDRYRFTKMDPRGAAIDDPLNANLYGYAGGNPNANSDPSGLFSLPELLTTTFHYAKNWVTTAYRAYKTRQVGQTVGFYGSLIAAITSALLFPEHFQGTWVYKFRFSKFPLLRDYLEDAEVAYFVNADRHSILQYRTTYDAAHSGSTRYRVSLDLNDFTSGSSASFGINFDLANYVDSLKNAPFKLEILLRGSFGVDGSRKVRLGVQATWTGSPAWKELEWKFAYTMADLGLRSDGSFYFHPYDWMTGLKGGGSLDG